MYNMKKVLCFKLLSFKFKIKKNTICGKQQELKGDEIIDLTEDFGTEWFSPRERKTGGARSTSRKKRLKVQARLLQKLEAAKTSLCLLVRPLLPCAGTAERNSQAKASLPASLGQPPLGLLLALN